jgi:hypothetical protein
MRNKYVKPAQNTRVHRRAEIHNRNTPKESVAELAVASLDGTPNPLDMDFSGVGESPSDLDLDDADEAAICSKPRRSHPAADTCIICGQPVFEDCACDGCQER